jgi:hypothetical protein
VPLGYEGKAFVKVPFSSFPKKCLWNEAGLAAVKVDNWYPDLKV